MVFRDGTRAAGVTQAAPRMITVGGPDLLVLDVKNVLWRWRPADDTGRGTTTIVKIIGSAEWGDDLRAIGTFVRDASAGLYNFYVVDPSEQNILAYSPSRDGSGFPSDPQPRLAVNRSMAGVTDLVIDGNIFVADDGTLVRFVGGRSEGWELQPPGATGFAPEGDILLRPAPSYEHIASNVDARTGLIYAWDRTSSRVVAIDKAKGTFVEQYRLAGGSTAWQDVRAMYVVAPAEAGGPATLVWVTQEALMSAVLEGVPDEPVASPGPSSSSGPAGAPSAAPSAGAAPSSRASAAP